MLLWAIWSERTSLFWSGAHANVMGVVLRTSLSHKDFCKLRARDFVHHRVQVSQKWSPPSEGWLKVNVDGAWLEQDRRGGVGACVMAATCRFDEGGGVEHMEARAMRLGILLAMSISQGPFLVECDSMTTVQALTSSNFDSSFVGPVYEDCKMFLCSLSNFRVAFAPRCCNSVADKLAKFGTNSSHV